MVLKPLETKGKNSKKKFPDDNPGLKPRFRELKKKFSIAVSARLSFFCLKNTGNTWH